MTYPLTFTVVALAACLLPVFGDQCVPTDTASIGVRFSPDGKSLAVLGDDKKVRVLDLATRILTPSLESQPEESFAVLLSSGYHCATIATNGAGRIRDIQTGRVITSFQVPPSIPFSTAVASSANSALFAVSCGDPEIRSGNRIHVIQPTGQSVFHIPAGLGGISSMAFSPDGTTLAAAAYDADIRIWDVRTGALKHVIQDLPVSMFDVAFSPDGNSLAAAGADRRIHVWDTQSWKSTRTIKGQPEAIGQIRFSPNGSMLLTGGFNERNFQGPVSVILWDATSGRKIRTWPAEHAVWSLSFAPDGTQVAVADNSKNVKLFSVMQRGSSTKR
jgi:WD40 repeat protein